MCCSKVADPYRTVNFEPHKNKTKKELFIVNTNIFVV